MKKFLLTPFLIFLFAAIELGAEPKTEQKAEQKAEQKNIIIFVADGLRGGSVNSQTPNFERVRSEGVRFDNSHSLFPTVTTTNASVIATGHASGDTGNFSNYIFIGAPISDDRSYNSTFTPTPNMKDASVVKAINKRYGGDYLGEISLLTAASKAGFSTAAVGLKRGPTIIQDVRTANLIGTIGLSEISTIIINGSTGLTDGIPLPDSILAAMQNEGLATNAPPNESPLNVQQRYFTDVFVKVVLPQFEKTKKPFVTIYWCSNPDAAQHNTEDSLNQLQPGVNGATALAGVQDADMHLGIILNYLDEHPELKKTTDVIVVSDHGMSTISKKWINADCTDSVSSYAAGGIYKNLKGDIVADNGSLPLGFFAIDLANALKRSLFDPDGIPLRQNGILVYPQVGPGQYPIRGNGLIGYRAIVDKDLGAHIVVANGGGCALIYLTKPNPDLVSKIYSFLLSQDYVGGIFVNKKQCANLPGTLGIEEIGLQGSTKLPVPTMVVPFRNFALDASNPTQTQVLIANTGGQEGQGSHGSFGRGDTFNFMAAMGPSFKKHYTDVAPVSNADVAITCAKILGLDFPSVGKLQGRVIEEALVGTPGTVTVTSGTLISQPTSSGLTTQVIYQDVGKHRYFDAGGFPGRTVGIP